MITNPKVDEIVFRAIRQKPLIVVCAWCADGKAKTEAAIAAGNDVTHGMCPACAFDFMRGGVRE